MIDDSYFENNFFGLMSAQHFLLDFEKPLKDLQSQLEELRNASKENQLDVSAEIQSIEHKIAVTHEEIYTNLTAWQRIQLARHPKRPYAPYYFKTLFTDFQELHGDRCFGDDQALIGGTAFFEGEAVVVVAQQKGTNTKENLERNFGMPEPEGYRKALRLMRLAEKFDRPVITFIDTAGAYPGLSSEERHVAEAIAVNLREMSLLKVPILTVILGEGGSGGALGIGVADRLLMLENAYYSVISPEGAAAILWKDRAYAPQSAEALKISAQHLLEFGIIEAVVKEPLGGAHCNPDAMAQDLHQTITEHLRELVFFVIRKTHSSPIREIPSNRHF